MVDQVRPATPEENGKTVFLPATFVVLREVV
jgi:hypothetical protein